MKLITQPDDGVARILAAIESSKESVEITVFRFDRKDIDAALRAAVDRGVKVSALVAYANRGGEKLLRKLEQRFLQAGMIVARTADNLIRYHNKLMIIDRRILFVFSFNFTHLDIDRSRSFAIESEDSGLVQEAIRLFEADSTRTEYAPKLPTFVVSPSNARTSLGDFIDRARKQLLIYDPEISDIEMTKRINGRIKAGVEVRILGCVKHANLEFRELNGHRLHTRAIVRDGRYAFIGSQSLRAVELDKRREVGVIIREPKIVKSLTATFESDWAATKLSKRAATCPVDESQIPVRDDADKVARLLIKELKPIAATVKKTVKRVVAKAGDEALHDDKVKETVKRVVKKAVKDAVKEVAHEAHSEKLAAVR